MSNSVKWLIAVLVLATASSVAALVFTLAGGPDTDDDDAEEAVAMPSHLSVESGRTVITLDAETRAREEIQTAPVTYTTSRAEMNGTAVVLGAADLVTARNAYVAARTKVQRDEIAVKLSRSQYERIKTLYEADQNMSRKAMEDAEATYRSNEAQMQADAQDADLQLDVIRQQWGATVAGWATANGGAIKAVLNHEEFLVRVAFPPGETPNPPATVELTLPGEKAVTAKYVSPSPQVNAQIQGASYIYLASGRSGMAAGMNLRVLVHVGRAVRGAVIPDSAVVWWRGKPCVYEALSPDKFARREVAAGSTVSGGYFVPGLEFPPSTKVVMAGAQALLSEEFRNQIQQED